MVKISFSALAACNNEDYQLPTLLLLNETNHPQLITYPYAFVQVSEVADRFGIEVIRRDLVVIPQDQKKQYLIDLLSQFEISMIGITVRNTDSLGLENYYSLSEQAITFDVQTSTTSPVNGYFPINKTKGLVEILREITDLPITIGGFGFSVIPEKVMDFLKPDFGVIGGADGFFEHFQQVLTRQGLDGVPNLVYFDQDRIIAGPKIYYPPSPRTEYTHEIIVERQAMLTHFPDAQTTIAVEISRGCQYRCDFCCEPVVQGTKVQKRDLAVLEQEFEFLGTYGLNRFYFVCCEMNGIDNSHIMDIAKMIHGINNKREPMNKIVWYATYLMRLSAEEMKILWDSGWEGGWFDMVSLDDSNLQAVKSPYRTQSIINSLVDTKEVRNQWLLQNTNRPIDIDQREYMHRQDKLKPYNISLFFGNLSTTLTTIQETLRLFDEYQLNQYYDTCGIISITRIFDFQAITPEIVEHSITISPQGVEEEYNEIYPSFANSIELVKLFGSLAKISECMKILQSTYFSSSYRFNRDWVWFLGNYSNERQVRAYLEQMASDSFHQLTDIPEVRDFINTVIIAAHQGDKITNLYFPQKKERALIQFSIPRLLEAIFLHSSLTQTLNPLIALFGSYESITALLTTTPYELSCNLFSKYDSHDQFNQTVKKSGIRDKFQKLFISYILYKYNIPFSKEYKPLFPPLLKRS